MDWFVFNVRYVFIVLLSEISFLACSEYGVATNLGSTAGDTAAGTDDSDSSTEFMPYNCAITDPAFCDAQNCTFQGLKNEILNSCNISGQAYCDGTLGCFNQYTACRQPLCPPSTIAVNPMIRDDCSDALSTCLANAASLWGTQSLVYRESSLMEEGSYISHNPDGFGGVWYIFSDSEDGGLGESQFDVGSNGHPENDGEKICVSGTASQIKYGKDGVYWGAGFGLNLCGNSSLSECGLDLQLDQRFLGVKFDIEGYFGSELRVLFHEKKEDETQVVANDSDTEAEEISAYVRVPSGTLQIVAFVHQADVWYDPSHLSVTADIDAVQFHIATNALGPTPFNFCLSNLAVLLRW